MAAELSRWLSTKSLALDARGLSRQVRPRPQPGAADTSIIDLSGNDYLGLSTDPRVVEASITATRTWGTGSTGSRLVSGATQLHDDLETELASWCGQPAALLFSSGYLANLGVVTALSDPGTLIVIDAHAHASLHDAARLSRARTASFAHNDVGALEELLRNRREPRAIVLTESVFSVLGDAAPLAALAEVCEETQAVLLVDEAHALGVTGSGRGSVAAGNLADVDHVVVTGTLSKAFGGQGGVVLGSRQLRDHLVSRARPFIFDTALAPAAAGTALAALGVIEAEPDRVVRLGEVALRLADACGTSPVAGAVLSVRVGSPADAVAAASACLGLGLRVGVFRPPSVPDGVSRLRMAARATLDDDALDVACSVLSAHARTTL